MKKHEAIAKKVSKRYLKTPNLIGIIWIGSSSYGICDEFADIDIQLIVDKKDKSWAMEQFREDGIKVEVSQMEIDWLMREKKPDSEQFWIRGKAIILHDSLGNLKERFKKANHVSDKDYEKITWRAYKDIFNRHHASLCFKRGDNLTTWMYFFKTLDALTKFIFLYHKKAVPTFKWRWYFIRKEKLFDPDIFDKIASINQASLEDSLKVLEEIEGKAKEMMIKRGYDRKKIEKPWRF